MKSNHAWMLCLPSLESQSTGRGEARCGRCFEFTEKRNMFQTYRVQFIRINKLSLSLSLCHFHSSETRSRRREHRASDWVMLSQSHALLLVPMPDNLPSLTQFTEVNLTMKMALPPRPPKKGGACKLPRHVSYRVGLFTVHGRFSVAVFVPPAGEHEKLGI